MMKSSRVLEYEDKIDAVLVRKAALYLPVQNMTNCNRQKTPEHNKEGMGSKNNEEESRLLGDENAEDKNMGVMLCVRSRRWVGVRASQVEFVIASRSNSAHLQLVDTVDKSRTSDSHIKHSILLPQRPWRSCSLLE